MGRVFWDDEDHDRVIEPRVALTFIIIMLLAVFAIVMAMENAPAASAQMVQQAPVNVTTQVQQRLASFGYTVAVDGQYGPQTTRAVRHFQKVNGLVADGVVGPLTSAALGITAGATAVSPAVRGAQTQVTPPPPPPASGPCAEWADELTYLSPGWDVAHMQRIMYRESRCQPGARNGSGAAGLLQIMPLHIPNLGPCGVYSASDLLDGNRNICSAAIVYRRAGGLSPWASTR